MTDIYIVRMYNLCVYCTMAYMNSLFELVNGVFSICLYDGLSDTIVGDYVVTSRDGGLMAHFHSPTEINHEKNSFVMRAAYCHNHNVAERTMITQEGDFTSSTNGLHSHKWTATRR